MLAQPAPDQPVRVFGDGEQKFNPLYAGDLVDAIIAAASGAGEAGIYDLVGPDQLSMAEMVSLVNGFQVPLDLVAVPPTPTVEDVFAHPAFPGSGADAVVTFGLTLTPMRQIWPLGAGT
jgi:NADH dehydrogenase